MAKILIIDDEESIRAFLADTLKFAGYETISASNGSTGLQMADQFLPDLILSDVHMPNMDGYTLLRELRSRPQTNTIPVIFLTVEDGRQAIREGMTTGADDYLPKPVLPADILAAVRTQLKKRATIEEKHDTNLQILRRNIIYALPHEFRTPLSVILGYAQLLEIDCQSVTPNDIRDMSLSITSAGHRLQRLIENYLVFAQLELIAADPGEREAARNHLVKNAAVVVEDAAVVSAGTHKRASDLKLSLSPGALRISEANLEKIVSELVDNAFKFSKPGTPVLVNFVREDQFFILSIRDSGRGMSSEQLKLMGAYMQFGRELFEQQGLGLGFVVAQRLVQLHDGGMTIVSTPGEGTLITVRFPAY